MKILHFCLPESGTKKKKKFSSKLKIFQNKSVHYFKKVNYKSDVMKNKKKALHELLSTTGDSDYLFPVHCII